MQRPCARLSAWSETPLPLGVPCLWDGEDRGNGWTYPMANIQFGWSVGRIETIQEEFNRNANTRTWWRGRGKKWLAANGPASTQQFGEQPQGNAQLFWDRFMAEFRLFVCGDKKYKKDRDKLLAQATPTTIYVVSGISSVIAWTLGLAVALITPAIAILLHIVGKVDINAWCEVS